MKSLALGVAVMLLCASRSQDAEPSIAEELQALVAKVNAHESFRLRYSGTSDGGESSAARLEIAYRDPDRAFVKVEGIEEGFEMVFDGAEVVMRSGESSKRARLRRSAAADLFEELFPTAGAIGPGLILNLRADATGFQLSTSVSQLGRRSFFGFFSPMIARPGDVLREDGRLVWREEGLTVAVSRESGFPEAIDVAYEDRRVSFRLEEHAPDVEIELPRDAEADEELQASFDRLSVPEVVRQGTFTRLALQLSKGMRALDDTTRRDFETFLAALHAEWIDHRLGAWMTEVRRDVDAFTAWARAVEDRTAVEEKARTLRADVVAYLAQASAEHRESVADLGGADLPAELLDLERTVIERLHAERVSGPLLDHFDGSLEAALGD